MATIPGTVGVTGIVAPKDSADTYAVGDIIYIKGAPIIAPTLTDLQNYSFPDRQTVGQFGITTSDNKIYILTAIGTPNTWVEYVGSSGSGDISGTLTTGKLPVATGTKTIGDSTLTQTGSDVACSGQLTATNLSGTNTGDQDLTNMPTTNQKDAMNNADNPSASNPFVTEQPLINFINSVGDNVGKGYNGEPLYLSNGISIPKTIYNNFQVNTITDIEFPSTETVYPIYINQGPYSNFIRGFRYAPDFKTAGIKGGITIGRIFTAVSDITWSTYITGCCYHIKKYEGATVTITGTGTSRTVTTTNTPFVSGDANTNKKNAGYLETPSGSFQIIGYGGGSFVTIDVPSSYVNETSVPFKKWKKLYDFTTGNINQTISHEVNCFSAPQYEYSIPDGDDWGLTDEFGVMFFADTSSPIDLIKVDLIYAGSNRPSHVDIHGFIRVKSHSEVAETSTSLSTRRSRTVSGTGAFNFNFYVPEDAKKILDAYVEGYPSVGAAGAGKTITRTIEYNNKNGESIAQYSLTDSTPQTYDLTGYANARWELSFIDMLAYATAGCSGGINIDHVSVDANIDYVRSVILYI